MAKIYDFKSKALLADLPTDMLSQPKGILKLVTDIQAYEINTDTSHINSDVLSAVNAISAFIKAVSE